MPGNCTPTRAEPKLRELQLFPQMEYTVMFLPPSRAFRLDGREGSSLPGRLRPPVHVLHRLSFKGEVCWGKTPE